MNAEPPLTPAEEADRRRYLQAMHGVQSAIALDMEVKPANNQTSPKHLRVGIDSLFVQDRALHKLLMDKGIITRAEYLAALANAAEEELRTRNRQASIMLGKPVVFG